MGVDSLGREVYIKAVQRKSHEWQILEFLSSPKLRLDPANHTLPVISILRHHDGKTVFIVQPRWGMDWYSSSIETTKQLFELTHQLLEGLAFMHRNLVGHGVIRLSLYFDPTRC